MRRAGTISSLRVASHPAEGIAIAFQHFLVGAADDQQRGSPHGLQRIARQVRTPAAGNNRVDPVAQLGRRDKSGSGAGAGAKQADGFDFVGPGLIRPAHGIYKPLRQQCDIKDLGPVLRGFLRRMQKIEKQRCQPHMVQLFGNEPVSGT